MAEVINQLPGSTFFSIVFFLMLITVGLDSSFGGIESMVTSLRDLPTFKKIRNEYVVCELTPNYLPYNNDQFIKGSTEIREHQVRSEYVVCDKDAL